SVTMATPFPLQTTHHNSIPDDIICPICMDKYSLHASHNPVMLSDCGHTICRDCFISIYKAAEHNKQVCPICRAPYTGPHPNTLPANFIVLSMMQAHLSNSKENAEHGASSKEPVEHCGSSNETEDFRNNKSRMYSWRRSTSHH
ncbi:unnamed protein product, partial [Meganyctiphanes norvegica]